MKLAPSLLAASAAALAFALAACASSDTSSSSDAPELVTEPLAAGSFELVEDYPAAVAAGCSTSIRLSLTKEGEARIFRELVGTSCTILVHPQVSRYALRLVATDPCGTKTYEGEGSIDGAPPSTPALKLRVVDRRAQTCAAPDSTTIRVEEIAADRTTTSHERPIAPGRFTLADAADPTACSPREDLSLEKGHAALASTSPGTPSCPVTHPLARDYPLQFVATTPCGAKVYEGEGLIRVFPMPDSIGKIKLVDHRASTCPGVPAALVVEETAPFISAAPRRYRPAS